MRVALFLYGITSLKGGGGAERFFSDFFQRYNAYPHRKFELSFIIDRESLLNLQEVGRLKETKNLLDFKLFSNRFKNQLEGLQLILKIITNKIRIIHIPLYNVSYVPLLRLLNMLPSFLRPKLVVNIVNCYAADALADIRNPYHQVMSATYLPLFWDIRVDGYFCWNKNFEDYLNQKAMLSFKPGKIQSITSRFSDVENFFPAAHKEKWVVFASRLDAQKKPEWFLESIQMIKDKAPNLLNNWKFKVCGDGPLKPALLQMAKDYQMDSCIDFLIEGQMYKILNHSRIYVSCQDYDNFPSLTMAEAMAAGNAIIARNVGQTALFVKDKVNGLLMQPDSPEGLADALISLMQNEQQLRRMGEESEKLIREKHNFTNFVSQIEEFWCALV